MPNLAYRRGAQWERDLMDLLVSKNWSVIRSAGSHKAADLLAGRARFMVTESTFQPQRRLAIQCKTGKARIKGEEIAALVKIAIAFDAEVIIATRRGRKRTYTYLNPATGSPEDVTEEWFS